MSTRKKRHNPVLYISQPITQFPTVMMQDRYSTREETAEKQGKVDNETVDTKKVVNESSKEKERFYVEVVDQNPVMDEAESTSNPFDTKRKRHHSLQRVKHFREMNITEKLVYLENFPVQLAPISCLYSTETTTYTGILLNRYEEAIDIKLPNNTKATIMVGDLQDIRMLGFH